MYNMDIMVRMVVTCNWLTNVNILSFISVINQLVHETATYRCDDTRGRVMQFWPPDDEHMCSKHVEAWNKLIVKQKFCASSWLITEIIILRCTVSKVSKFCPLYRRLSRCLNLMNLPTCTNRDNIEISTHNQDSDRPSGMLHRAGRLRLKCDGTRAETRFRLSAKRTSPFKSAGALLQSTSLDVIMLDTPRSGVVWRVLATHSIRQFPLHFPSRASLCAITFQLDSTNGSMLLGG